MILKVQLTTTQTNTHKIASQGAQLFPAVPQGSQQGGARILFQLGPLLGRGHEWISHTKIVSYLAGYHSALSSCYTASVPPRTPALPDAIIARQIVKTSGFGGPFGGTTFRIQSVSGALGANLLSSVFLAISVRC